MLINLTPHPITLCDDAGAILETVPPSGTLARVAQTPGQSYRLADCPVPIQGRDTMGQVEGIPKPAPGVLYIVSGMVAAECTRHDVVAPGTGPADNPVRDPQGRIVGVRCLKSCRPAPALCTCGSGYASPGVHGGCAAGDQFCG
jgi:hypothetical protein